MFGTKMDELEVQAGRVTGVWVSGVDGNRNSFCGDLLKADAVVLAVGHSARDVFDMLLRHNVSMTAKPFAVSHCCSAHFVMDFTRRICIIAGMSYTLPIP